MKAEHGKHTAPAVYRSDGAHMHVSSMKPDIFYETDDWCHATVFFSYLLLCWLWVNMRFLFNIYGSSCFSFIHSFRSGWWLITRGFSGREGGQPSALKNFMKNKTKRKPVGLQKPSGKLFKRRNRRHKLWIKKMLVKDYNVTRVDKTNS